MRLSFMTLLFLCSWVSGADPPDYEKLKKEWSEKVEKEMKKQQGFMQEEVDRKNKEASELRAKAKKAMKQREKKALIGMAEALESAARNTAERKGQIRPEYALSLTDMRTGDFGKIGVNQRITERPRIEILQVLDKKNALLKWGKQIFWVETNTEGWVDGKFIDIADYIHATGTRKYQTALGTKTVLVIKIVK